MLEFTLPDMTCGHCVKAVTAAVQQLDPQARLEFDLPQHKVRIEATLPQADEAGLRVALAEAGYPMAG